MIVKPLPLSCTLRPLRGVALTAIACLGLGAPGAAPVAAQDRPGLSIDEALAMVLEHNPDVVNARATVDIQRGLMAQARAPFDPKPQAAVTSSRTIHSGTTELGSVTSDWATLSTDSSVGLAKLFRSGIGVASTMSVSKRPPTVFNGSTFNQVVSTTTLTVPLMQGLRGGLIAANDRAGRASYQASLYSVRAAMTSALYRATVAYWNYRAAFERAAIQRAAADRSRRAVDEVTILIQADERPKSDIDLMMANAASREVAQVQAELQITSTRSALALLLGLDAQQASALAPADTSLPDVSGPERLPVAAMVAETLTRHSDVMASRGRTESARLLRDGAATELQPRVNLVLGAGFTGQFGAAGIGQLSSLLTNLLGPNASMQIVYQPTAVDSQVRGALIRADALYRQASTDLDTLSRTIGMNIEDASREIESSRAQLNITGNAIERSRLALATVQRNFELGTATLFDRILAEDTVTNAELADLAVRLSYASSLAKLQAARAVLVQVRGDTVSADVQQVKRLSLEGNP